jgi:hypothetical protein
LFERLRIRNAIRAMCNVAVSDRSGDTAAGHIVATARHVEVRGRETGFTKMATLLTEA